MRTTEAARYARWSAILALMLVVAVACVYARRSWQTRRAQSEAPAGVPPSVEERSAAFTYSKASGPHTVFTVRASRATEFAEGGHSLLEDVWITAYGQKEERFDNLHARSCDLTDATDNIICSGDVQIDLQGAEDHKRHPGASGHPDPAARVVHIGTTRLVFDQKTGMATTDQPVSFQFPQGEGRSLGLSYDSQQGELTLPHDVALALQRRVTIAPADQGPPANPPEILNITGSSMVYRRDEHAIHLFGPVDAREGARELVAGKLDVELDENFRARHLVATGRPELRETDEHGSKVVSGDELSGFVSAAGWAERLIVEGSVRAEMHSPTGDDHVQAERAELEFAGQDSEAHRLTVTGNVTAQSNGAGGQTRNLSSSRVVLDFAPRTKGSGLRIAHATAPAATLDSQGVSEVSGKMVMQRMRLTGQQLDVSFTGANELRELHGTHGVRFERQLGNAPWQTTTSQDMAARFAPRGEWVTVDQTGEVCLRQGNQTARGDRAHFDRSTDSASLAGSVVLSDLRSRTTASSATFRQMENELRASGNVVTNEIADNSDGATNLSQGPARISSDHVLANTAAGHAVYSGSARLWQGNSIVEADTIEMDHPGKVLTAIGHVRAVFPKAEFSNENGANAQPAAAADPPAAHPEFWYAEAPRMIYTSNDGRAHLEGGASGHSAEDSIRAETMDLFFAPAPPPAKATVQPVSQQKSGTLLSDPPSGEQQLVRATALDNVVVDEEGRHGTAQRADYTAADEKFVLSDPHEAAVRDSSGNDTKGRQLTFFFGDDRIIVDSAEGLRTRTLHRVEK